MRCNHLIVWGLDWGNVPTWFGAGSVFIAYRALRRGDQRAERAQVSDVYLINTQANVVDAGGVDVVLTVINRSGGPVYEVAGALIIEERSGKVTVQHGPANNVVIQPDDQWPLQFTARLDTNEIGVRTVCVIFRDAQGVRWARMQTGQIVNMKTESYFWLTWPYRAQLRSLVRRQMTVNSFRHYEL